MLKSSILLTVTMMTYTTAMAQSAGTITPDQLTPKALKKYCIHNDALYSVGAVIKMKGNEYRCERPVNGAGARDNNRPHWAKVLGDVVNPLRADSATDRRLTKPSSF